jgi:hypothetical protein
MVKVKKGMEQGWRIHHVQRKETEILKTKKKRTLVLYVYTPTPSSFFFFFLNFVM